ncbi:Lrp/AsnC family transcriptional regulator [Leucobacter allii]|uniref:Lrp/AsnC family transcriptional regulator n=1 Tax=Leucobacter allii TaxID=2932247 RepID=UPI001FD62405|nr:Lrp/AsnC family transcriptional regulator [Leucobacter allii]UOR01463.1 Lrp/AsnC family transcriptional regulator [Leucobacter allii]
MDELDAAILAMLGRDGRRSFTSIAAQLGLSEGTVRHRVQRMTDTGMLVFVALCNPLSLGLQALRLFISVDRRVAAAEEVCAALAELPCTNRVSLGTGSRDVYVELTCRDLSEAQRALDEIRSIRGIADLQTSVLTRFDKDHSWGGLRGGTGQAGALPAAARGAGAARRLTPPRRRSP